MAVVGQRQAVRVVDPDLAAHRLKQSRGLVGEEAAERAFPERSVQDQEAWGVGEVCLHLQVGRRRNHEMLLAEVGQSVGEELLGLVQDAAFLYVFNDG